MILRLEDSDVWGDHTAVDLNIRFTRLASPAARAGRRTCCELWGPTLDDARGLMRVVGHGLAGCHSRDQFEKARGRKIALGKAMTAAGFSKADRTKLWAAYFAVVKDGPTI